MGDHKENGDRKSMIVSAILTCTRCSEYPCSMVGGPKALHDMGRMADQPSAMLDECGR